MDIYNILIKILSRGMALSFGDYILSSGIRSPYYIDFAYLANRPDYLSIIVEYLEQFILNKKLDKKVDRIGGISNKGILLVPSLSIKLKKPFFYIDKMSFEPILGIINPYDKILIIDDLINTGITLEKTINSISSKFGTEVEYIVVLLDREEGGVKRIREMGVKIYSLVKISRLAKKMRETGVITEEEYNIIIKRVRG